MRHFIPVTFVFNLKSNPSSLLPIFQHPNTPPSSSFSPCSQEELWVGLGHCPANQLTQEGTEDSAGGKEMTMMTVCTAGSQHISSLFIHFRLSPTTLGVTPPPSLIPPSSVFPPPPPLSSPDPSYLITLWHSLVLMPQSEYIVTLHLPLPPSLSHSLSSVVQSVMQGYHQQ